MRRRIVVASLVVTWMLAGATAAAGAGTTPTVFLPNVRPLAAGDLSISGPNTHRKLHFSFSPENIGTGPMELQPKAEDCNNDGDPTNDRTAYQNVYGDTNGNGVYDWPQTTDPLGPDGIVSSTVVGCFVFDPSHGHWHFKNYAKYQLLSLRGRLIAKRTKVGFCLIDDNPVETLPGTPEGGQREYFDCGDLATQGISVGWADVYGSFLSGQSIRIGGVSDGKYCLVEKADPKHQLQESVTSDNQSRLKIQIQGTQVQALANPC